MTPFDYEKNDIFNYSDDSLRILKDKIEKELERREQEKETEAKKKVMKAIQDYLAAGYTLHIEGEVESEDEDYNPSFRTLEGVIEEVHLKDDEVILSFCEAY
jgi:50S ribosomal subunit-associated GTPase HflX